MTGGRPAVYDHLRAWLTPGLENSQFEYVGAMRALVRESRRWLDLGCGRAIVPDWMAPRHADGLCGRAIGVDLDADALRAHRALRSGVLGDGHSLPFRDGTFDLITANMVVEHVARPWDLFHELRRVLAPGGRVLLHTPNLHGYTTRLTRLVPDPLRPPIARLLQRRHEEDVYRTYYRANTAAALGAAAVHAGLEVERIDYVLTSPQLIRIGPLLALEMLWIRHLTHPRHVSGRPVIIAVLSRPSARRGARA